MKTEMEKTGGKPLSRHKFLFYDELLIGFLKQLQTPMFHGFLFSEMKAASLVFGGNSNCGEMIKYSQPIT